MKELVTVLIPILNQELEDFEKKIISNSLAKLEKHPITFICAEGAIINPFIKQNERIDILYFPDKYFESHNTFSKLLLLPDFHERFSWAEFVLIHHLNNWIVKAELHYWCKQGYDLLNAAPTDNIAWINRIFGVSDENKKLLGNSFEGNGITLFLIEPIIKSLKSNKKVAYQFRNQPGLNNPDQVFWELIPNRFIPSLRKPSDIVRDYFAMHLKKVNKKSLPFVITGITNEKNLELTIGIIDAMVLGFE